MSDSTDTTPDGPPAAQAPEGREGREGRNRRRRRPRGRRERPEVAGSGETAAGAVDPSQPVRAVADEVFSELVSGAFDAEDMDAPASEAIDPVEDAEVAAAGADEATEGPVDGPADEGINADGDAPGTHRRVLAPDPDAPKLHKVMAQSGLGSRRDLEAMIEAGRVTVNGEVAHTGQRVGRGDRVQIDGKAVRLKMRAGRPRVIAYHKPVGELVTLDDPQQRPTVFRRLPRLAHGKWQSVGRLDLNTEGLLLFTDSGELANQLMHPRFGVEREYAVRVLGRLDDEGRERLIQGVDIDGQPAAFLSIEDGGGEGANHWYRVSLTEGRHREVRRLFDAVGLTVSRLIRIRYGCVVLPRGLKRGAWIDLGERDVDQLRRLTRTEGRGDGRQEGRADGAGRERGRRGAEGADAEVDRPSAKRGPRAERGDRPARAERPPRAEAGERPPRAERRARGDRGEEGPIPNPLQQTFDKRALKESQRRPQRDYDDDGPIPNPLQQTFDQRALKESQRRPRRDLEDDGPIPNPLQQTYDKRALQEARREAEPFDDDVEQDHDADGPIPNPLMQTFDRRFAGAGGGRGGRGGRSASAQGGGAAGGGAGAGRKTGKGGAGRGASKGPRPGAPGGSGGPRSAGGAGAPGGPAGAKGQTGRGGPRGGKGKTPAQPDPMRTAVGYIGGDALLGGKSGRGGRGRRGR